jgi:hypothetical protein
LKATRWDSSELFPSIASLEELIVLLSPGQEHTQTGDEEDKGLLGVQVREEVPGRREDNRDVRFVLAVNKADLLPAQATVERLEVRHPIFLVPLCLSACILSGQLVQDMVRYGNLVSEWSQIVDVE